MKKQTAGKYKKNLSCTQGPTPETIDLAIKICFKVGSNRGNLSMEIIQKNDSRIRSKIKFTLVRNYKGYQTSKYINKWYVKMDQ